MPLPAAARKAEDRISSAGTRDVLTGRQLRVQSGRRDHARSSPHRGACSSPRFRPAPGWPGDPADRRDAGRPRRPPRWRDWPRPSPICATSTPRSVSAGPARGWWPGGRRWPWSSGARSPTSRTGAGRSPAGGRRAAHPGARPGAGRARRQPHRSGVHRRPLWRSAVRRAAPGRAGELTGQSSTRQTGCPPRTSASRRRCGAPRPATRRRPLSGTTCAPWLDAEWRLIAPHVRVIVALGGFAWQAALRLLGEKPSAASRNSATACSRRAAVGRRADGLLSPEPAEHVHRSAHPGDAGRGGRTRRRRSRPNEPEPDDRDRPRRQLW